MFVTNLSTAYHESSSFHSFNNIFQVNADAELEPEMFLWIWLEEIYVALIRWDRQFEVGHEKLRFIKKRIAPI